MVCTAVGFCAGLEDTRTPMAGPVKLYTGEGAQALVAGLSPGVGTTDGVKKNDTYCRDCTKFFQDVQESITSPETEVCRDFYTFEVCTFCIQ